MADFLALGDIVQLNKDDAGMNWIARAEVIHLPNGPGEPWGFRDHVYSLADDISEARAHLAARVAELEASFSALDLSYRARYDRQVADIAEREARATRAEAELAAVRGVLRSWYLEEVGDDSDSRKNAPGHCHDVPGIWDMDNRPGIAGKPCARCALWAAVRDAARGAG